MNFTPASPTVGLALIAASFVGLALPWETAQAAPPEDPHGIATLQVENDAVSTLRGTSDQYYTSGLRAGYTTGTTGLPDWLNRAGNAVWGDGVQRVSIDLSQSIFTPRNTQINPPDPKDRPYAGYLRVSAMVLHDDDNSRGVLGVSLGIVGPAALGRQVQNGFHNLIGDTPNKGWEQPVAERGRCRVPGGADVPYPDHAGREARGGYVTGVDGRGGDGAGLCASGSEHPAGPRVGQRLRHAADSAGDERG